jgi:hypothetical protein
MDNLHNSHVINYLLGTNIHHTVKKKYHNILLDIVFSSVLFVCCSGTWLINAVSVYVKLVPYDAVNRNKVPIRQLSLLFCLLAHYMFRPLRAILRWDMQLMFLRTILTTTDPLYVHNLTYVYWYFDPWSPIHVIKRSIKVVKKLIFTVKLVSYIKYKMWKC